MCFLDSGTSRSKRKACKDFLGYLEVYCTILFDGFVDFVGLAIGTAVSPSTLFKVK